MVDFFLAHHAFGALAESTATPWSGTVAARKAVDTETRAANDRRILEEAEAIEEKS